ncbi:MAG TPA: hypothetical protein VFQ56_10210 [Flavobacterium sp.]|nr:hypothetical protein [Flavobacterium sp.]
MVVRATATNKTNGMSERKEKKATKNLEDMELDGAIQQQTMPANILNNPFVNPQNPNQNTPTETPIQNDLTAILDILSTNAENPQAYNALITNFDNINTKLNKILSIDKSKYPDMEYNLNTLKNAMEKLNGYNIHKNVIDNKLKIIQNTLSNHNVNRIKSKEEEKEENQNKFRQDIMENLNKLPENLSTQISTKLEQSVLPPLIEGQFEDVPDEKGNGKKLSYSEIVNKILDNREILTADQVRRATEIMEKTKGHADDEAYISRLREVHRVINKKANEEGRKKIESLQQKKRTFNKKYEAIISNFEKQKEKGKENNEVEEVDESIHDEEEANNDNEKNDLNDVMGKINKGFNSEKSDYKDVLKRLPPPPKSNNEALNEASAAVAQSVENLEEKIEKVEEEEKKGKKGNKNEPKPKPKPKPKKEKKGKGIVGGGIEDTIRLIGNELQDFIRAIAENNNARQLSGLVPAVDALQGNILTILNSARNEPQLIINNNNNGGTDVKGARSGFMQTLMTGITIISSLGFSTNIVSSLLGNNANTQQVEQAKHQLEENYNRIGQLVNENQNLRQQMEESEHYIIQLQQQLQQQNEYITNTLERSVSGINRNNISDILFQYRYLILGLAMVLFFVISYFLKKKNLAIENTENGYIDGDFGGGHDKHDRDRSRKRELASGIKTGGNILDMNGAPRNLIEMLNKYGNLPIASITIVRQQIPTAINYVYSKLLPYDKLYHLSMLIRVNDNGNMKILKLEKQSFVSLREEINIPSDAEYLEIPPPYSKTLNESFNMMKILYSNHLWNYHPFTNNCQIFIMMYLSTLNKITEQVKEWVLQDKIQNYRNPYVEKFSLFVTRMHGLIKGKLMGGKIATERNLNPNIERKQKKRQELEEDYDLINEKKVNEQYKRVNNKGMEKERRKNLLM